MPAPIPTRSGELYAWWNGRPYVVFDLIRGRTARGDDWRLTAQALKRVRELADIKRAEAKKVPQVVCHRDFGGFNLLIDNGQVAAILDWEQAVLGPGSTTCGWRRKATTGSSSWPSTTPQISTSTILSTPLLARALRDMAAAF